MDREHLFRAYDNKTKKFIATGFDVVGETTMFDMIGMYLSQHKEPIETVLDRLSDVVVDMYSTLTDSTNTKIFEGDLFPIKAGIYTCIGEVVLHKAMFCIRFKHPEVVDPYTYVPLHEFLASGNRIIAGNIHDNKDLLDNN